MHAPEHARNDALPARGKRSVPPPDLVAALEEDIVLGRLLPRERLIEDELIARFGTTRHMIRQALAALDAMGLVERVPNRGAQVRAYSAAEVVQLHHLRDLLEAEAARLIPLPLAVGSMATLRAVQDRHDRAAAANDAAALFRANLDFHRCLFGYCGNAFLAEAIAAAAQRAHGIRFLLLRGPESRERSRREHHAMLAAIARGDRDGLVQLCRAHLLPPRDAYLRDLGQHSG